MIANKWIKVDNNWVEKTLSKNEIESVLVELNEFNSKLFLGCQKCAENICGPNDAMPIAIALFEKAGIASYTAIEWKLSEPKESLDEALKNPSLKAKIDEAIKASKIEEIGKPIKHENVCPKCKQTFSSLIELINHKC